MGAAVLLDTPLIVVTAEDGVVRATVENRADVGPEEGAEIARRLVDTLGRELFVVGSRHRGLVLDVRGGPDVFGPKTRDALETLFRSAEATNVPVAVLVSSTTQRMQFDSMVGLYAPGSGRLFDDPDKAAAFARAR